MARACRAWIIASVTGPSSVFAGFACPDADPICYLEPVTNRFEPLLRDQALLQTRLGTHAAIRHGSTRAEEVDVNYNDEDGEEELTLDIQWPNGDAPAGGWPAVIALHGNGQTKGSLYYFCRRRVRDGRLCMAPNRRNKIGSEKFNSKLAIQWLFANAAIYNVNVNKVVLYGYSKGGFITNNLIWLDPEIEDMMAGVIVASGVGETDPDKAHAGGPPMLLISCVDDKTVKYEYTENMYNTLVGFQSDVTLWTCSDGHSSQKAEGFDEQVDTFLDRVVPTSGELSAPDAGGVATTAAPTTTTSTNAPIAPKCMDWCTNHPVNIYCEWDSCTGCDACSTA